MPSARTIVELRERSLLNIREQTEQLREEFLKVVEDSLQWRAQRNSPLIHCNNDQACLTASKDSR